MSGFRRSVKAAVLVAAFTVVLASCSSATTASDESGVPSVEGMPSFDGPFADEFSQTWEQNDDAFIRGVIEDQQITGQEWAETVARMKGCFESAGMTVTEYNEDGSYAFDPGSNGGEAGGDLATGCEESSGVAPIGHLRIDMQTNPDNRDVDEIMHECLVRVRAVPQDYTLEDYRRDNASYAFPFVTKSDEKYYDECAAAPLTAQRE